MDPLYGNVWSELVWLAMLFDSEIKLQFLNFGDNISGEKMDVK